jgi:hypothetical protein
MVMAEQDAVAAVILLDEPDRVVNSWLCGTF